jgi:TetR/AcrR family transcriptional repressor of bet genes
MARSSDPVAQQEAISEAVWRVLSADGLQGLTLRAVAREAGCTTGLVLHRFPDKKALLVHARLMLHERTHSRMLQEIAAHPDPRAALDEVIVGALLGREFDSRIWLGFLAATISAPELTAVQNEAHRHFSEAVSALVARCRPDWDDARIRDVTVTVMSMISGMAALGAVDPAIYTPDVQESSLRATTDALMRG